MKNIRSKISLVNVLDDVEENMLELRDLSKREALGLLLADSDCEEDVEHYKNLNKGIDFLLNAMANEDNIALQVDSDADGYLSSALMYQVIYDDFDYENVSFILNEGREHGFQLRNLDTLVENDIKLLIIPDGGSTDIEPLKAIVDKGIQVLILDHHIIEIEDELHEIEENVALINNQDKSVDNIYLSGSGVTYKFCKELIKCCEGNMGNKYLDLVACSLISDVCNLKYSYENRYYLNIGSKVSNITNPFLKEMAKNMNKNKKGKFSIEDFGFAIAPVINATIRLGTKKEKEVLFNALIGTDNLIPHRGVNVTYQKKARLTGQNYQKKQREEKKKIATMVNEEIKSKKLKDNKVIMYIDKDMKINASLNGLVANQLLETYERPIIIGKISDGVFSGSARGYGEMDFKNICEQSGLFEYCLGHDNAFGVSIREENIEKFLDYINEKLVLKEKKINVEKIYDNYIPNDDVKKIVLYESLWCSDIKSPLYFLENATFKIKNITKIGNSTYKFENDNVTIYKYFCSKATFEELIGDAQENESIILDALVEFRYKYGRKIIIKNWERVN